MQEAFTIVHNSKIHTFNPGEVAEWLKAPVSKTGISGNRDRGFESRPLRHTSYSPTKFQT